MTAADRRFRLRGGKAGVAASACAVCCATPVLTLLGIGVTGAAAMGLAAAFAGVVFAVVVAGATIAAVLLGRRQARPDACAVNSVPAAVSIELGQRPEGA
jgi:hypothetical protein